MIDERAMEAARRIVREVAELPDRTSPEDQPEMMLVTDRELSDIVANVLNDTLADARALLAGPAPPPADIRKALEPLNEQLLNLARHLVANPKPLASPTQVRQLCRELLKAAALTSSPPGDGKLREALESIKALSVRSAGTGNDPKPIRALQEIWALADAALSVRDVGEGELGVAAIRGPV